MKLTNRSKIVSNKEQSTLEKMYLPAIAKGMMITASHIFKKSVTTKYPDEIRPMAPVYRGQHVLKRDENGAERCTACDSRRHMGCPILTPTKEGVERCLPYYVLCELAPAGDSASCRRSPRVSSRRSSGSRPRQ